MRIIAYLDKIVNPQGKKVTGEPKFTRDGKWIFFCYCPGALCPHFTG